VKHPLGEGVQRPSPVARHGAERRSFDEHTREAHRAKVARTIGSESVRKHLDELFAAHDRPEYLRADNGREFISEDLKTWLAGQGGTPVFTWIEVCNTHRPHRGLRGRTPAAYAKMCPTGPDDQRGGGSR
jgi:hypothetical protein